MTSRIELVVARYHEDLRWLRRVPKAVRVTVYDKGGDGLGLALPNVGRDAHTYLTHIVQRYDALAPVTVFAQGKPFDHVHDFHAILRDLAAGTRGVHDFLWLGFMVDWDDDKGARLFQAWSKNPMRRPLPMNEFSLAVWGQPARSPYVFYPGAHFAVTADLVRRQPRSFYEQALNACLSVPDAESCMERCLDRLFGVTDACSSLPLETLPRYTKPIRRLIDAAQNPAET